MEMTKKMGDALNKQFNAEIQSAYLYASMAAWFESENLKGFSAWMNKQAEEEMKHAFKIKSFLYDRQHRVVYGAVPAPPSEWKNATDAIKESLKHEQLVSNYILGLRKQALAEDDAPTEIFLQWFVTEQVEEEDSVVNVLNKLAMVGDSPMGMYNLDREMGMRA